MLFRFRWRGRRDAYPTERGVDRWRGDGYNGRERFVKKVTISAAEPVDDRNFFPRKASAALARPCEGTMG